MLILPVKELYPISSSRTLTIHGVTVKIGLHTLELVAKLNSDPLVDHAATHVALVVSPVAAPAVTHVATHAIPLVVMHVKAPVVHKPEAVTVAYLANGVFGSKAACRLINDLSIL